MKWASQILSSALMMTAQVPFIFMKCIFFVWQQCEKVFSWLIQLDEHGCIFCILYNYIYYTYFLGRLRSVRPHNSLNDARMIRMILYPPFFSPLFFFWVFFFFRIFCSKRPVIIRLSLSYHPVIFWLSFGYVLPILTV